MKKITSLFAVSALALTFAATGCKKKEGENKEPAMKPEEKGSAEAKKEEGSAAAKPEEKKPEEAKPAAGGGDVPAECADYKAQMEKLMGCEKAKAAAGPMKEGFDTMWKSLEAAPAEAKAAMASGCKTAADSIKTTLTTMGC